MATIKAILNKQYQSKDGLYQLVIRISHNGKRKYFDVGYAIPEDNWDEDNEMVVDTKASQVREIAQINQDIRDMLLAAKKYDSDCKREGKAFIFEKVYPPKVQTGNLCEFLRMLEQRYIDNNMLGSSRCVKAVISDLVAWKGRDVTFQDFEAPSEAKNFYSFLVKKGNKPNTLRRKFVTLRTYWKTAIKEVKAPAENPFADIRPKRVGAKKVWLSKEQLNVLENASINYKRQRLARDMFMFSFYCYGMRFANVISVKKTDIHSGRIHWKSVKGNKHTSILIRPALQKIVDKYKNTDGQYLFPLLNNVRVKGMQLFDKKATLSLTINTALKLLAKNLELPPFTFHSARHSFATEAINQVPIHVLKNMLTHSSVRETEIYINGLDIRIADEYAGNFYDPGTVINMPVEHEIKHDIA